MRRDLTTRSVTFRYHRKVRHWYSSSLSMVDFLSNGEMTDSLTSFLIPTNSFKELLTG